MRVILHIDLNQFFVRCEEIKNPSLIGKPVGIGHEGRGGIISTCSYKAREYGVKSGMPTFQAKMLCKDLILITGDYEFYSLMSREFIVFIKKYTNIVEQASIDECYADFTDIFLKYPRLDPFKLFKDIQAKLFKKTGLKCSIGVSTTRFLAKMGSDYKKPMGITIIRKKDIAKLLFPLDISEYYGIGRKTYPKLKQIGINTIGDLYFNLINNDKKTVELIGNFKEEIIVSLQGKSSNKVSIDENIPKSIGRSHTLERDSDDPVYIFECLLNLTKDVIKSLKIEEKLCKTITITFKDAKCNEDSFKVKTFSNSFQDFTDDENFIIEEAKKIFLNSFNQTKIRLIGVSLKNFIDKNDFVEQLTIFNYEEKEKESKSFLLINELNKKFNDKIFIRLSDLKGRKNEN